MALPCPCQHSTGTNKGACKLGVGMGMWVRLIAIVAAALGQPTPLDLMGPTSGNSVAVPCAVR